MFDYAKLKDPEFFKEHVLEAHSDHICYPGEAHMRRRENPFRCSLNGLWKFSYARTPEESLRGFELPETDCHGWPDIRVPAHIQMEGYDIPCYVNYQYPWDGHEQLQPGEVPVRYNPTANYVRYFTVPEEMKNKPLYISFQGVESGMVLWLNGKYVGYSEDSFTPSEFELTPYLEPGENKLAVQVIKWTGSSWAEDQDFFRFSGIFRDVYLYTHNETHIQDLKIKTLLDDTYTQAELLVETKGCGNGSVRAVLRACDAGAQSLTDVMRYGSLPSDTDVLAEVSFALRDGCGLLRLPVEHVRLWSAEEPNLYELLLKVYNEQGEEEEAICEAVGFRKFEIKDGLMCLNGRRIVWKGVNRHEFSSRAGRVPQEDEILQDVCTMKQFNINAIRTSHYPNDSRIYRLCDRLGIYMMDENNMESHGSWEPLERGAGELEAVVPCDQPKWREMMLDRVRSVCQRDKNHAAVLIWSCGNESFGGSVIHEMANTFRALDDTRLVHYEGVMHDRRYCDSSDMESQMYTPVKDIRAFLAKNRSKPFLCCEYSHAMGNSCGGMHKYTELTEEEPLYQGGFIWDYVDQSIYRRDRYGKEFQAYGGDFGDRPTDYNFSGNGIVYGGDRSPSPKMQEVKYNYQNISARVSKDRVLVINRNLFVNTAAFACTVTVARDGILTERAELATDVEPLSQKEYKLPVREQFLPGEYTVTVSFALKQDLPWARAGHEVAFGQGVYRIGKKDGQHTGRLLEIVRGNYNLGVRGEHFETLFSYLSGGLVSYRYGGEEMLETIPKPNFWRAPTDNDEGNHMPARSAQWKIASLYLTHKDIQTNVWAEPLIEERDGSVAVTYTYSMPTVPASSCRMTYTVYGDGTVEMRLSFDPALDIKAECSDAQKRTPQEIAALAAQLGELPEFGILMKMKADYDTVEWYGMGPEETYADRCMGAKLGIYRNRVEENMARYLVPQECGNKVGVRWAKVRDRYGRGLMFEADDMNFSALPYTPHELENARHPYELPPVHYTVIRMAARQMGIAGDDSWGARPHREYLIDTGRKLEFTCRFRGI